MTDVKSMFEAQHLYRASHADSVIYSITTCPYCMTAKNALSDYGYSFNAVEVDRHEIWTKAVVKPLLSEMTNKSVITFPQIFIDGKNYDCHTLLEKLYSTDTISNK
jgi:glutaredoxin